jgi:SAM-dependent methyltransferase
VREPLLFDADEPLPLTGERTAPDIPDERYWFVRHLVVYRWAQQFARVKTVIDAGSGEGYGTALLADVAGVAAGCDLEVPVLARGLARYGIPSTAGNLVQLPFRSGSVDLVVSLQTIEHLHSPVDFLAECRRILGPEGRLIVSTPNRLTFSPDGVVRNPFHTFEFSPHDLSAAINRDFEMETMLGVFHGARIKWWERRHRESFTERLIREPAPNWSASLRRFVHETAEPDFLLQEDDLDNSLDLIAVARPR